MQNPISMPCHPWKPLMTTTILTLGNPWFSIYFLANASSFRGDAAKKLKQELKDMVKEYNKTRN